MSPREKILKKKQTKGYNPENMEEKTVNDINKGCGNNKVEPQKRCKRSASSQVKRSTQS